ncbi:heavy metal translocating P-type ATPase, partial [Sulfurihydrogenibium sp.]|uniref:heavy metal translocating P-type ATPase n=1 Tax=Sulfurihydrogenibium sp. TaxID=2053621 RepID=UPI003D11E1ED
VFFDKTGTITDKFMKVSTTWFKDENAKNVFFSLEKNSEHPLAKSFVKSCQDCKELKVENFKVHFGFGISGNVEGKDYILGSEEFLKQYNVNLDEHLKNLGDKAIENGEIVTFLSDKKQVLGFVSFSQSIRPEAKLAVDALKSLNIEVGVLTGDTQHFANVLKKELGIEDVRANLLPEDKLKAIEEEKAKGKVVAMVGDGINDAPALTAADIGIAMGCGTDLTRESASISLISDDLRKIPLVIILSRKVKRVIYTNIFWAFIYNIIGMGLAVSGHLNPVFAALAMVLSSVFVIGNSLRVKSY